MRYLPRVSHVSPQIPKIAIRGGFTQKCDHGISKFFLNLSLTLCLGDTCSTAGATITRAYIGYEAIGWLKAWIPLLTFWVKSAFLFGSRGGGWCSQEWYSITSKQNEFIDIHTCLMSIKYLLQGHNYKQNNDLNLGTLLEESTWPSNLCDW